MSEIRPRGALEPERIDGEAETMPELDQLARLLDSRWRIPGTGIRFGVDAVAGLIPGVGDVATGLISAYIVYQGARLGAPPLVMTRMVGNVVLDTVVGSIPLLGSIFDVYYKANNRNVRMLQRHFDRRATQSADLRPSERNRI